MSSSTVCCCTRACGPATSGRGAGRPPTGLFLIQLEEIRLERERGLPDRGRLNTAQPTVNQLTPNMKPKCIAVILLFPPTSHQFASWSCGCHTSQVLRKAQHDQARLRIWQRKQFRYLACAQRCVLISIWKLSGKGLGAVSGATLRSLCTAHPDSDAGRVPNFQETCVSRFGSRRMAGALVHTKCQKPHSGQRQIHPLCVPHCVVQSNAEIKVSCLDVAPTSRESLQEGQHFVRSGRCLWRSSSRKIEGLRAAGISNCTPSTLSMSHRTVQGFLRYKSVVFNAGHKPS